MNIVESVIKRVKILLNKDYNHYQEIDSEHTNNRYRCELIHKIALHSGLDETDIDEYSESQVLDLCNESSTVKCQLNLLYNLSINEYLIKKMDKFVTRKKEKEIQDKHRDAEYMTSLYHLKKNKIYPSDKISKQDVISMYSNFCKKISSI